MGITGKYDFPGIKKFGAKGLMLLLGSFSWFTSFVAAVPFVGWIIESGLELFSNWLANKGLIVLNIGAIIVEGEFDQKGFDSAMDAALAAVGSHRDQLTDVQKKAIDDTVIKAFRKFAPLDPNQ